MSSMDIEVVYRNNDNSSQDVAILNVFSTDPANSKVPITLSAEDRPCLSPTGVITIETANPTGGMEVCVNCNASDPGGPVAMPSMIARCDWAFAFANPIPPLMPNPGMRTCFTPADMGGLHILSLTVTNECGAVSSAATETIPIRSRM
jgi:hypothetical protein